MWLKTNWHHTYTHTCTHTHYLSAVTQALIVADSYGRTGWINWVNPLYRKVVVGGDFRYLSNFKSAFPLKANLFQELANKSVNAIYY